jgi:hypothetical protein
MEDGHCSVDVSEPDTGIDEAVVEDFVRLDTAGLLHLVQQGERSFQV